MYRKRNVPMEADPTGFLNEEFSRVEIGAQEPAMFLSLSVLNKEPDKVFAGLVVLADGVNWNPGSGSGYYGYRAGAWQFLG